MNYYVPDYNSYTKQFTSGSYNSYKKNLANDKLVDLIKKRMYDKKLYFDNRRSILDRSFDFLLTPLYATAGVARGIIRDDMSIAEGFLGGIRAGNPLGKGYEKGEHTYSKVLEDIGWKPESTVGKVAKGVLGFGLDVLLDPSTYMTFGTTALLKGTGRAGAMLTHGISEGITKDSAKEIIEKHLTKKADDAFNEVISKHLVGGKINDKHVLELAKEKKNNVLKLLEPSQLDKDAEKLAKEFNRLAGVDRKAGGITVGGRNMMFGDRIFKNADDPKTLIGAEKLQNASERLGIAKRYAKIRESIYGGKLGELFAPNSIPYRLSKENPAELYNYFKMMEFSRGATKDKLDLEKSIREYGSKLLNLTEAENKKVLELMQNKTIWNKVSETIKFADTQTAKDWAKRLKTLTAKSESELQSVLDKKNHFETLASVKDVEIKDKELVLNKLKEEYRKELTSINANTVEDIDLARQAVKALEDEINIVEREIDNLTSSGVNFDKSIKSLDSEIKQIKKEVEVLSKTKLKADQVKKVKDEFSFDVDKSFNDYINENLVYNRLSSDVESFNKQIKEIKQNKDLSLFRKDELIAELTKKREQVQKGLSKDAKLSLIKNLSKHIYGNPNMLGVNIYPNQIEELVGLIRSGKSKKEIREFIEKNPHFYSGKAQKIYSFLGEMFNYGSGSKHKTWYDLKQAFLEVFSKEYVGKIAYKQKHELTDIQKQLIKFRQMELDRAEMSSKLFATKNNQELEKVMREIKDSKINKEYIDKSFEAGFAKQRDSFYADDRAIDKITYSENIESGISKMMYDWLIEKGRFDASLNIEKAIKTPMTKLEKQTSEYVKRVIKEVPEILKEMGIKPGRNFDSLSLKQQNFIFDVARSREYRRANNLKITPLKNTVKEEIEKKVIGNKIDTVLHHIRNNPDATVITKDGVEGKIVNLSKIDDEFIFKIKTAGSEELFSINIKDISGFVKPMTDDLGELKKISPAIEDQLKYKNELLKKLSEEREFLTYRRESVDVYKSEKDYLSKQLIKEKKYLTKLETRKSSLENIQKRIVDMEKNIKNLESTRNDLINLVNKNDEVAVRKAESLAKLQQIINDDMAFEQWFNTYKPEQYKHATTIETGRIVLDDMPIDDKIKDIVRNLRSSFNEMAEKEIGIGKLKRNQYESMMNNYVAHILTADGKELIKKTDVFEDGISLTSDMGYGLSFNPHALSRTIKKLFIDGRWVKNPTIEQINKSFKGVEKLKPILKDNNVFSENIAEIYVTRALKHTELMYDDRYMRSMLDVFGRDLTLGELPRKGYKAVINFGMFKENLKSLANKRALQKVDVKNFDKGLYNELRLKEENLLIRELGFKDMNHFRRIATPMLELNDNQLAKIHELFGSSLTKNIDSKKKIVDSSIVKEVGEGIVMKANQARMLSLVRDHSRFLDLVDKFTHFIKLNQTAVMPAFHMRNKMSNIFNNWLAVGRDAANPKLQVTCWNVVKHMGDVEKLKYLPPLTINKPDGTSEIKHWYNLYKEAVEHGVIDEGFFAKDLGAYSSVDGKIRSLQKVNIKGKDVNLDPTDTKNFWLYKKGTEFGSLVENSDRFLHYVSLLRQGRSAEEAAESSIKFLFDYSDITAFEASVMKRVFPYYVWLRKNSALQLEQLIAQPEKYRDVAKVLSGVEGMTPEEERINKGFVNDFAKDWIQTPFNVHNPEGRLEPVLWNPNLSFMDLSRIPNPFHPTESAKDLFTQTNPLIKVPLEMATNTNAFFESPIVREGESPIIKGADYASNQLAIPNVVKGMATKHGVDLGLHTFNALSGIKMLSYDYDAYKYWKIKEMMERGKPYELDDIKRAIKKSYKKYKLNKIEKVLKDYELEEVEDLVDELFK